IESCGGRICHGSVTAMKGVRFTIGIPGVVRRGTSVGGFARAPPAAPVDAAASKGVAGTTSPRDSTYVTVSSSAGSADSAAGAAGGGHTDGGANGTAGGGTNGSTGGAGVAPGATKGNAGALVSGGRSSVIGASS